MRNKKDREENTEEKRFKIFGVEFVYLCLLGIIFAFFGWIIENLFRLVSAGVIDSRFHILPFISPYGLIVFAVHLCLKNPDDLSFFGKKIFKNESKKNKILSNIIVWLIFCTAVFLSELAVGNLWDLLFGVKLWNHMALGFNVTQYTSLFSTLGFGTGAYLAFKFVYIPLLNFIRNKVSYKVAKWIVCTLGVIIVLDTLFMIGHIIFVRKAPMYWRVKVW